MKKVFIFYICFCLLFSQSIFGVEEVKNIPKNIVKIDIQDKNNKISNADCDKQICPISSKSLVTKNLSITNKEDSKKQNKKISPQIKIDMKPIHISEKDDVRDDDFNNHSHEKDTKIIKRDVLKSSAEDFEKKATPLTNTKLITKKSTKELSSHVKIRINEILAKPLKNSEQKEFIELYNETSHDIKLDNFYIYYKSFTSKKGKQYDDFENKSISANGFIVIYPDFRLSNAGAEIILYGNNENILSKYSYKTSSEGVSWNYDKNKWYTELPTPNKQNIGNPLTKDYPQILINEILPNPQNSQDDEFIELYNPTKKLVNLAGWTLKDLSKTTKSLAKEHFILPNDYIVLHKKDFKFSMNNSGTETISLISPNGKVISTMSYNKTRKGISLNYARDWYFAQISPGKENYPDPKTLTYPILQLSEILPNPIGQENASEFIEIYNPNATKINLKYWTLKDASKTGSYIFAKDTFIQPKNYFVIYRRDFKFALNNGTESISLIAPNEKTVSKISYKSAKEGVSYNFEQATRDWRWSKYLTPDADNIFNNLPQIVKFDINKKIYKNVYAEFSAKAKDINGEKLKVRWNFGDEHRSYKWKTRHKYEKTGIYNASLRIQDGSEEITKNFKIVVKKYPKYDVEITKISPNPSGKDSGVEYITIKNNSHKKITLTNWSIATGTSKKTLVNHPINEKLIINPGKTKNITKKYCALTLPNKTGTIEIRRPSGSVSDKLKYGDKNISIPDNAIYEKMNQQWQWIVPKDLEKLKQTQEIVARALANEQILAQQQLESIMAYNTIHNSKENVDIINHKQNNLLDSLVKYINLLLNKAFLALHSTQKIHTKKLASQFPLYTPHYQNTNPCKQPTIYNSNKLHFCQN